MDNQLLSEISIRNTLQSGDIGYVIHLHGLLYQQEYGYGLSFESYVATGLSEFCDHYDPTRNRVWVCEHLGKIIGFMLLIDRGTSAQLRYFIIAPPYRGIGLGKKLMELYIGFMKSANYKSSYLLTMKELVTATTLYEKYGFKLTKESESISFGKPVTLLRYELNNDAGKY